MWPPAARRRSPMWPCRGWPALGGDLVPYAVSHIVEQVLAVGTPGGGSRGKVGEVDVNGPSPVRHLCGAVRSPELADQPGVHSWSGGRPPGSQ